MVRKQTKCRFCNDENLEIDYKNVDLLKQFISDTGKILPRRVTKVCLKHQRKLSKEIKRAREMALIPFVVDTYK